MKAALRWLRRLLLAAVALLCVVAGAVAATLWWSLPPADLQSQVPGLEAPVRISFDADGIPWITAQSDTDAAAALGFVHARDRMFQMELMRRAASGRLSEIVGPATLPLDRTNRALGLRRRAEADLADLDPRTRALLDAYARGVNAWIARRGRFAGLEFIALGQPEPWTPVDSLLWGKTMSLYLGGNWRVELWRAALSRRLAPEVQKLLWPGWPDTPRPDAALIPSTRLAGLVPDFPAPFTLPNTASNEWAVDGHHSVSGAPLLAGDPHLAYGMPGIWYLARIETPGHVLAGATAPGIPFLVLGHNGRIAWTFTTTGADTQDVFVETSGPGGTYQTPDGPKPFITREERIRVRGQPDDVFTVRETRHGPVLSDIESPRSPEILAVAMTSLLPHDVSAAALAELNRAENVDQAGQAAGRIVAPVQNLLVADRERIAQFTTGRIPIRRAGDGAVPVAGADGAHDWVGFAAGLELPHQIAPASGRLVNANERIAPPDFPVFMGAEWFGDWRAQRIRELLDAKERHAPADFAAMQVDATSTFARAVLPVLLKVDPADAPSRVALEALRRWDGTMRIEDPEPLLFHEWMRRFTDALLRSQGAEGAPIGASADLLGPVLTSHPSPLCGGDCAPMLRSTLADTVAALPDWANAPWGLAHQAIFAHPLLSRLPLLGRFGVVQIAQPGDNDTLFRGGSRPGGWASVHGPGFRGVYDLADLDASLFALAPGQSGNPLSPRASSTLRRWRDGEPIRLGRQPERVTDTIALHP
jgi:penicillin amidase